MIKNILVLFFLLFFSGVSQAQNEEVYVSVAMQRNHTLDSNSMTILKNKLFKILSSNGVSGTEYGAIVMVPEVAIIDSSSIYGGMRQISSVELEITLTVRNMITNTIFNTIQISSKGEGYSETEAKRSAITKIDVSNPTYGGFIEVTKSKILEYYHNNSGLLIEKANALASQQLFDEALALLSTYPESLSGYSQVLNTMTSIFKKSQTQYCSQILFTAQAAYSNRDLEDAVAIVATIDAQSSCAKEAKELLATIKKDLDKQYNDALALEKEQIRSNERMKTAEIKAIKDIATAYFKRQSNYVFVL